MTHALPTPINGDFDIPLPDDSSDPITSDFGRLEPACHVVTMEEQRRMAEEAKRVPDFRQWQLERSHWQEVDAGLHNLHEPFEGLLP